MILDMVKEKEVSLSINKRLLQIISEKISFGKNIKRKKEEELLSDTIESNPNNFDLFNPLCHLSNFSYNLNDKNLEDNNNEVEENKDEINNYFEFNLSPSDGDIENEADEISLLNIDNISNITFLQL